MTALDLAATGKQYAERVLERAANGVVVRSELVPLEEAGEDCVNPCGHKGVKHTDCWPYSLVECAVCGRGLGTA